jgi:ATP-dependent DNA helicase RecQ
MHSPSADPALDILRTTFGHAAFRGAQREIVEHVTAGGDALVLMPTGGKFVLPVPARCAAVLRWWSHR